MAERVQERLEAFLPEIEDLRVRGIFNEAEIQAIIKKRTSLEYAVSRRIAKKSDFLRYLEYEMNLDQLRLKRRSRLPKLSKPSVSDFAGVRHIYQLFERALLKFKGDLGLWLQYIDFAQSQGANRMVAKAYGKAIRMLPTNQLLWVQAATWEFSINLNMEAARTLLQRGIRLNGNSDTLWLELFRLELKYLEKLKLRKKLLTGRKEPVEEEKKKDTGAVIEVPTLDEELKLDTQVVSAGDTVIAELNKADPILSGAIPMIVYNHATQAIPSDLPFRLRFLDILSQFSDTEANMETIYNSIQSDFQGEPLALDVTIRKGLDYLSSDSLDYVNKVTDCIKQYESKVIDLNHHPDLVTLYVTFLNNQLAKVKESNLNQFLSLKLKKTLSQSRVHGIDFDEPYLLPQSFYTIYINFAQHQLQLPKLAKSLVEEACNKHPKESSFWKLRADLVDPKDLKNKKQILALALENLPTHYDLWKSYLNISILNLKEEIKTVDYSDVSDDEDELNEMKKFKNEERFFLESLDRLASFHPMHDQDIEDRNLARDLILNHLLTFAYEMGSISYVRDMANRVMLKTNVQKSFFFSWIDLELSHYGKNPYGDAQNSGPKDQAMAISFASLFSTKKAQMTTSTLEKIQSLYEQAIRLNELDLDAWLEYLKFLVKAASQSSSSKVLLRAQQVLSKEEYNQLQLEYRDIIKSNDEEGGLAYVEA